MFLEKFVDRPRHIEVQILADGHGNCVHLGERECSIQRRHQKLIEECPSPVVDEATRARIGEIAVRAARAVGYTSAGTVEMLRGRDGSFYFMEVNARLQVEHPVTEMVTGVDLVKEQIRVAAGEPLSFRQEDVRFRGHAIECRIIAEDPARNFMPAPGTIRGLRVPSGPGVRYDGGTYAGYTVPVHYDALLSKLVDMGRESDRGGRSHGACPRRVPDRRARHVHHVSPQGHATPRVPRGRPPHGVPRRAPGPPRGRHEPLARADRTRRGCGGAFPARGTVVGPEHGFRKRRSGPFGLEVGHRGIVVKLAAQIGDTLHEIVIERRDGRFVVTVDGMQNEVDARKLQGDYYSILMAGRSYAVSVEVDGDSYCVRHGAAKQIVTLTDPSRRAREAGVGVGRGPTAVATVMPGKVVRVLVNEGDLVQAGQGLVVIEAMKMENEIASPKAGRVTSVRVEPGRPVEAGATLVVVE